MKQHVDSVPPYQREIYQKGTRGQLPRIPLHFEELQARAQRELPARAFAYVAGGAGQESTQRANRLAFEDWCIQARMLRDVSRRNLTTTVFGREWRAPLMLSPVGALGLVREQADALVARAAARARTPMVFSNQASVKMETCASLLGDTPRWFQLYWSKSNELVASLVSRAEACGCEAIVVTLDTPLLGWRPRDLQLGSLPFTRAIGLAQYLSDPVFQSHLDEVKLRPSGPITLNSLEVFYEACRNYGGSLWKNLRTRRPLKAVQQFIDIYSRTDLTWGDLEFLRKHTRLPIVLKGILCREDARLALEAGVDGIWVSNHGGRQVDGGRTSLDALVEVMAEVQERLPVFFDSGVRSGADVFKALALGATAVGLGRPFALALGLAGEEGVLEVLESTLAELDLTMAFAGCCSIEDIRATSLLRKQ
ncbi:MAG: alpha-hydroxy-acid oxidizing protein [Candidatus Eremiobacteraeota bacterium]|nr:alpha-hydroxy-acid oxidizing protein [Candidatus Eremiobacteraeota bacterium]